MTYVALISPLIAVAGLAFGYYYFRVNRRRTQLRYEISARPVFSSKTNAKITIDGSDVSNPYEVRISVRTEGVKDVKSTDFDGGLPLSVHLDAPLVANPDSLGSSLKISGAQGERAVGIVPQLLKCGSIVQTSFFVDGKPEPFLEGGVADADLVAADTSKPGGSALTTDRIVMAGVFVGLLSLGLPLLAAHFASKPSSDGPALKQYQQSVQTAQNADVERALVQAAVDEELARLGISAVSPPVGQSHPPALGKQPPAIEGHPS